MENMFKPSHKDNKIRSVEAVLVSLLVIFDTSSTLIQYFYF